MVSGARGGSMDRGVDGTGFEALLARRSTLRRTDYLCDLCDLSFSACMPLSPPAPVAVTHPAGPDEIINARHFRLFQPPRVVSAAPDALAVTPVTLLLRNKLNISNRYQDAGVSRILRLTLKIPQS